MLIKCETVVPIFDKKHFLTPNCSVIRNLQSPILTTKIFGYLKNYCYFIDFILAIGIKQKGISIDIPFGFI